ncbi:MAG: type I 3-dehydroquinate dehydratase [Promethearchaeota archaeon]
MKYKICVPIPIKSVSISANINLINNVKDLNPNLIELRLDYIEDFQYITKDFIASLLVHIQPKIPVICTFRDSSEGGQAKVNVNDRVKLLKTIIEAHPTYIDLEMHIDNHILGELIQLASQINTKIIYSYHNFEKTPSFNEMSNLLDTFLYRLKNQFRINTKTLEESIFKLIFMAKTFEDNLIPLKLCKIKSSKELRLISFCMGDLGLFSRIFCNFSGSFLTFSSIQDKTAPGQININGLREILQLLNFRI